MNVTGFYVAISTAVGLVLSLRLQILDTHNVDRGADPLAGVVHTGKVKMAVGPLVHNPSAHVSV